MRGLSVVMALVLFAYSQIFAQKIEVSGSQQSQIQYRLLQDIELFPGLNELVVSFVVPTSFKSQTYEQQISNLKFDLNPQPTRQETDSDERGNQIRIFTWSDPGGPVKAAVSFQADNRVQLQAMKDNNTPFPINGVPSDIRPYLTATDQVQSNHPKIKARAAELTAAAGTAYEACQDILAWVVEHMQYVLIPKQYDALYAFESGKGNCQNYSHLTAALMRASGIPARIVNGITLDRPYSLGVGGSEYQFEMAKGRHSWIEVYFPDAGWMPFDPQQTEFFVSNRYVRIEVGLDNNESINDGLVRWRQSRGTDPQTPKLEEIIETNFVRDQVNLSGKLFPEELSKVLLGPQLVKPTPLPIAKAEEAKKEKEEEVKEPPKKEEPAPLPKEEPAAPAEEEVDYTKLNYTEPFIAGNLEFPEGVNFAFPRQRSDAKSGGGYQLERSFLVETAEYVTSKEQFAQTFILKEPVKLEKIGLALHNFGGSGNLWLELSEDAGGKPGKTAVTSIRVPLQYIRTPQGYRWVDFDFSSQGIVLSPGRYWFFLNYSGGPIVNWFYTYGKPVGPIDGTRSRAAGQREWNKILSFEFNYRVAGKGAE